MVFLLITFYWITQGAFEMDFITIEDPTVQHLQSKEVLPVRLFFHICGYRA